MDKKTKSMQWQPWCSITISALLLTASIVCLSNQPGTNAHAASNEPGKADKADKADKGDSGIDDGIFRAIPGDWKYDNGIFRELDNQKQIDKQIFRDLPKRKR
jgi:hypothetical protein